MRKVILEVLAYFGSKKAELELATTAEKVRKIYRYTLSQNNKYLEEKAFEKMNNLLKKDLGSKKTVLDCIVILRSYPDMSADAKKEVTAKAISLSKDVGELAHIMNAFCLHKEDIGNACVAKAMELSTCVWDCIGFSKCIPEDNTPTREKFMEKALCLAKSFQDYKDIFVESPENWSKRKFAMEEMATSAKNLQECLDCIKLSKNQYPVKNHLRRKMEKMLKKI